MMTDDELLDLIRSNDRAWQVWLAGYQSGHLQGQESMRLSNEEAADLAARKFAAAELLEEEIHEGLKTTIGYIDVAKHRAKQRSEPRRAA